MLMPIILSIGIFCSSTFGESQNKSEKYFKVKDNAGLSKFERITTIEKELNKIYQEIGELKEKVRLLETKKQKNENL